MTTKESINSWKLGCRDSWRIANNVLSKGNFAIPPLFNSLKVLPSDPDKTKLFDKNPSKSSNLDVSVISLSVLPFRTNLKSHNCLLHTTYLPRWLSYGSKWWFERIVILIFHEY